MKLKFKYTDRFVGGFVLGALVIVVVAITFLAFNRKFFVPKYVFKTKFADANGLSSSTPIFFKGYEIGKIRSFRLSDENFIEAELEVYEQFRNKILQFSALNKNSNPITGITSIEFLQGINSLEIVPEGGFIPSLGTLEGDRLEAQKKVIVAGDVVSSILYNINRISYALTRDNNPDDGAIFRAIYNLAEASEQLKSMANSGSIALENVNMTISKLNRPTTSQDGTIFRTLNSGADLLEQLQETVAITNGTLLLTDSLIRVYKNPDNLAVRALDPKGDKIFKPLATIMTDLQVTLREVNELLRYANSQTPNVSYLIDQGKSTMRQAQRTMEGVSNNPFLKGGIPPEPKTEEQGAKIRLNNLEPKEPQQ
ncbi:MAG: MlaD family protein [Chloroherpetonaceae bacterium]|nr:MlaD family protein [Chloroherpetonaceae bacterium]